MRSERVCLPRLEAGALFLQGHAAPRPVVASAVLRAAATIVVIVGCGVRVVNLFRFIVRICQRECPNVVLLTAPLGGPAPGPRGGAPLPGAPRPGGGPRGGCSGEIVGELRAHLWLCVAAFGYYRSSSRWPSPPSCTPWRWASRWLEKGRQYVRLRHKTAGGVQPMQSGASKVWHVPAHELPLQVALYRAALAEPGKK